MTPNRRCAPWKIIRIRHVDYTMLTVRIPEKLKKLLERHCRRNNIKLTDFITEAIREKINPVRNPRGALRSPRELP